MSTKKPQLPGAVQKAKDKGIAIIVLTDSDTEEEFYFKKPARPDMSRFMAKAARQKVAQAVDELVTTTILSPSTEELRLLTKEQPGLMYTLNNALQSELGINRDFTVKKL